MEEPIKETPPAEGATPTGMTRRQMLLTATAGGAAIAVSALGGAAVGGFATRVEYEVELTKLRALVALYEQLEKVGLDAILATGMNVVRGALGTVRTGARLMQDGITAAEKALQALQSMLDNLRRATEGAAQVLADLQQKFRSAETVVGGALGTALSLTESIRNFFNSLVDKIPFGIGDNIRRAIDALVSLVRAVPTTIETLTSQLFKPLTDNFFPPSGTPAVKTTVLDPITINLLEPLKKFLSDVETAVNRWENDFTAPVQSALKQRQTIREQIAEYRKQNQI